MTFDTEQFIEGYIGAAFWTSSIGEGFAQEWTKRTGEDFAADVNLDGFGFETGDVSEEAMRAIVEECTDFITHNLTDLLAYCEQRGYDPSEGKVESYAGHDFWLTRNGHGAGFWDRGLGELGERLAEAARVYGESIFYIGDDERIYVT